MDLQDDHGYEFKLVYFRTSIKDNSSFVTRFNYHELDFQSHNETIVLDFVNSGLYL